MSDRDLWIAVRRGLLTVVAAIEVRWNLPRTSMNTLGASPSNTLSTLGAAPESAPHNNEPPSIGTLARSSSERVE